MTHIPVGPPESIDLENGTSVSVNGRTLLVTRMNEEWIAFGAYCPHQGWELYVSDIRNGLLHCPGHNYSFDVHTGDCVNPAWGPHLLVMPVEEVDGQVCIRLSDTIEPALKE